jgi:uncharacterized repeat protein (TIGR03803 family)
MNGKPISLAGRMAPALLAFCLLCAPAWSQTFSVIYNFGAPSDGANPIAGLVFDNLGNLYGTTEYGGLMNGIPCSAGCGTVYELAPNGSGGWNESILHAFDPFGGDNGAFPTAPVVFDRHGSLYGMINCPQDCFYGYGGVVFKLAPGSKGAWTISDLYSGFQYSGCAPGYFGTGSQILCSVAFDRSGQLFGSTVLDGVTGPDCGKGCGQIFLLGQVSVFSWYHIVAHNFADGSSDGRFPQGVLAFDASNNIYGTTGAGGLDDDGAVYVLTPNRGSLGWKETLLHSFEGGNSDGANPIAGVVVDAAGNVYGTTAQGGSAGLGTVYMLTPQSNGTWTETVLYSFLGGNDAATPNSSLTFDAGGNLYGTAGGGAYGQGTVFKLTHSGGNWPESIVHTFTGAADGGQPFGGVIVDASGNVYGTASIGGTYGQNGGVAFEITP